MSDQPPPDDDADADEEPLDPSDVEEPDPDEFLPSESGGSDGPPTGRPEKGRVLSPNDLEITDNDEVEQIDEGRFVVSAGGSPSVPENAGRSGGSEPGQQGGAGAGLPQGAGAGSDSLGGAAGGAMQSPEAARNLLTRELERTPSRYGLDIVGRFDGDPARHRTTSDDVVATFEQLVLWYARQVSDGTPTEEVLEILLREASVVPDPGTPNLAELLEKHDLTPHDSIAELVNAITSESGP
jgi:hypothetical protein